MNDINELVDSFVEVNLKSADDFLKVKETLTRIGVASERNPDNKKLFQSCHILHKRGNYYIVHFKELFALDGKPSSFDETDRHRRDTIANMLAEWGLVELVNPEKTNFPHSNMRLIKVIPFREKSDWNLVTKYTIGRG